MYMYVVLNSEKRRKVVETNMDSNWSVHISKIFKLIDIFFVGNEGIIEDVLLLGSPVTGSPKVWSRIGSVVCGKIINGYSRYRYVQKFGPEFVVWCMGKSSMAIAGIDMSKSLVKNWQCGVWQNHQWLQKVWLCPKVSFRIDSVVCGKIINGYSRYGYV